MPRKLALALAAVLPLLLGTSDDMTFRQLGEVYHLRPCPRADLGLGGNLTGPEAVGSLFRDRPETRAVLILADGCPALKAYAPGYSDRTRFISWSMAKTVTAMLVGALVSDGRLQLDAPAPIAEWRGTPKAAITLRQLLQMRSGLRHVEVGDPVENSDTNQALFVHGSDAMAAYAIAQPLEVRPGETFKYSSLTTVILAEIVARTLTPSRDPRVRAQAYKQFAETRLFGPAGVTSAVLEFDGAGTQIGGSLMYMTLGDWGRLGMLLLDGRSRDGRPVIAPDWLAFMKAPSPNPEYGAQTWLNRAGDPSPTLFPGTGPASAVSMVGHLGQYVIASPDSGPGRGVVVVRLGHTPDGDRGPLVRTLGEVVAGFDR